jgi:hypothetical protein
LAPQYGVLPKGKRFARRHGRQRARHNRIDAHSRLKSYPHARLDNAQVIAGVGRLLAFKHHADLRQRLGALYLAPVDLHTELMSNILEEWHTEVLVRYQMRLI